MDVLGELAALLPHAALNTDPDVLESYRNDFTITPTAGQPLALVRPETTSQVQEVMRWATAHHVAVIPRGAGTGLACGATAVDGAVILSMERMRDIDIDPRCQTATVEAGALNVAVKVAAAEHGLWYPPDPSSFEICSIGGNVATNAGGLCCVKYGVTSDYVMGLDVVLADGTLLTLGGQRIKDTAGLSLMKLFVGSEGVLGIVTRAVLRLVPAQGAPATTVAWFPTVAQAANAVVAIRQQLRPSLLELMDQASVNAVEDFQPMGLERTAGALLLAQSDAPGDTRTREVEAMEQACRAAGATETFLTADADESAMFIAARRAVLHALEARGAALFEDVGVPIPALPALMTEVAAVAEKYGVEIPVVAHAGDGNTHPTIIYDPATPEPAHAAFAELMSRAIALGGTITGEHGVGRLKKPALPEQLGPAVMDINRRIKKALDPEGLLNPGAVFDMED